MNREEERSHHLRDLEVSKAAQQALQNEAIKAYFDSVEAKAIDALLGCDALDDAKRLRLTIVAQTVRQLKQYLHTARDMGEYTESLLKQLDREDNAERNPASAR